MLVYKLYYRKIGKPLVGNLNLKWMGRNLSCQHICLGKRWLTAPSLKRVSWESWILSTSFIFPQRLAKAHAPSARSAKRSVTVSWTPETSTAEIRMVNRAPVLSFSSFMSRNSQEIAHGMRPAWLMDVSHPTTLYVFPGKYINKQVNFLLFFNHNAIDPAGWSAHKCC